MAYSRLHFYRVHQARRLAGMTTENRAAPLMRRARRTSRLAVASLVCGILPFLGLFPAGIVAIFLGHAARRRIRRTGENGSGIALAGLILGYLSLAGIVGGMVALFLSLLVTAAHPAAPARH